MTIERWLARRGLGVMLVTAAVLALLVVGIDTVERSRLLGPSGTGGDLLALVFWRLPGLGRELVPIWSAVSGGVLGAWLLRSGTWEQLQGTGVSRGRILSVLVVVVGVVGGGAAGALEVLVPQAALRAVAAEGRLTGEPARVAGEWVRLQEYAFRVGGASDGALVDVVLMRRQEGLLERLQAERVAWNGDSWVGEVKVQRGDGSRFDLQALPLPAPRSVSALVRPRATSEAGLAVLGDIPLPGARGWWHRRLSGLLAPCLVALFALGLSLRPRPGAAASVALSAIGAGSLHLLVAVLAEAVGGPGVWGTWGAAGALGAYLLVSTK